MRANLGKNIILDLCGGSGAWSQPYKQAGFDAKNITLPGCDVNRVYIGHGALRFEVMNTQNLEFITVPYECIYGILAAPPCTEFSVAKGAGPRDFCKGMETIQACMKIIWETQKRTKLEFWALENPRGLLRRFLGVPKFTFEQWQFGGDKVKATDIWGYFNPPTPTVKKRPADLVVTFPNGRSNARDWTKPHVPREYTEYVQQFSTHDERRAAARAITPAGFAQAFFRANSRKREGLGSEKKAL